MVIGIANATRIKHLKAIHVDGHMLCFPEDIPQDKGDRMLSDVLPETFVNSSEESLETAIHVWDWDECTYIDYAFYQLNHIDPHVFLLIFLPALIFESAYNLDYHAFTRQRFKILLLAGPVLLGCVVTTAAVMHYILMFDMTFLACAMFGAISSATDPVAVVSLLKELGMSKRISTLIEGESLLNDGTAMVVFLVLKKFAEDEQDELNEKKYETWSLSTVLWMGVRMSIISFYFGQLIGWLLSKWLNRIHNNPVLETNLTVCVPYILFYVAE